MAGSVLPRVCKRDRTNAVSVMQPWTSYHTESTIQASWSTCGARTAIQTWLGTASDRYLENAGTTANGGEWPVANGGLQAF